MSKAFKDYDKEYSDLKHTLLNEEWDINAATIEETAKICEHQWDIHVDYWTQEEVRFAVYEASDFRLWQQFRVSLKGWSTQVKLYRLRKYLHRHIELRDTKIRVDNYILALKRGGCLDEKLRILK